MRSSWRILEEIFTVKTIMSDDLLIWEHGSDLKPIREKAKEIRTDNIPVRENGKFTGILHLNQKDEVSPLTDDWIISEDATIPVTLRAFVDRNKPALLVSNQSNDFGIVTPADFNKLPARTYFYNLIASLEMRLAEIIQRHFYNREHELEVFLQSDGMKAAGIKSINSIKGKMKKHDLEIGIVHVLHFSELLLVVQESASIRDNLEEPYSSIIGLENRLSTLRMNDFRNRVMHTNNLILSDFKGINELRERIDCLGSVDV